MSKNEINKLPELKNNLGITLFKKFTSNIGIYTYSIERELSEQLYDDFEYRTDILRGKILTIIEASIIDKSQQKAVKDMIHESFTNTQQKTYADYMDFNLKTDNITTIIIDKKNKNSMCGSMPL